MSAFAKKVNGLYPLTIFSRNSISLKGDLFKLFSRLALCMLFYAIVVTLLLQKIHINRQYPTWKDISTCASILWLSKLIKYTALDDGCFWDAFSHFFLYGDQNIYLFSFSVVRDTSPMIPNLAFPNLFVKKRHLSRFALKLLFEIYWSGLSEFSSISSIRVYFLLKNLS